jgi:hypothetical protein
MSKLKLSYSEIQSAFLFRVNYSKKFEENIKKNLEKVFSENIEDRSAAIKGLGFNPKLEDWKSLKHKYLNAKRAMVSSQFEDMDKSVPGVTLSKDAQAARSQQKAKFRAFFSRAWIARWRYLIKLYKTNRPNWNRTRWHKYKLDQLGKKKNKKKRRDIHYRTTENIPRYIRYATPLKATGFLKESIDAAFKQGDNKYLKIPNPLVSRFSDGIFQFHHMYYKYHSKKSSPRERFGYPAYLDTILFGVRPGDQNPSTKMVYFNERVWDQIADMMVDYYRNADIEEAYQILTLYGVVGERE